MSDIDVISLLVLFWLGFSLPFLIVASIWRFSVLGGKVNLRGKEVTLAPNRFLIRLVLSVFGLVGGVGTASFVGLSITQIAGSEYFFLTGIGFGLWISIALFPWSPSNAGTE